MNEIQIGVFRHLISGSAQRREALNILTDSDFFTDVSEDESQAQLASFVQAYGPNGEGRFCDGGIARLYAAIRLPNPLDAPSEPETQVDTLYLNVHFDLHRFGLPLEGNNDEPNEAARDQIDGIMTKLVNLLRIAQGDIPAEGEPGHAWSMNNVVLDEWDSY